MILVTSAYGNNGRKIIPKLAKMGLDVRALNLSDKTDKLKELGAKEVIIGNALDPNILDQAMDGIESVFHVGPSFHPQEAEMGISVIDAASRSGVEHFVYDSVLHPQITELLQHRMKLRVEQHLINSELNYTILQPMHYMQNIDIGNVNRQDVFVQASALETPLSFVDMDDKVDVAVKVLTEDGHYGATYELCCDDNLNAIEIAEIMTQVMGREIKAKLVSKDVIISGFQRAFPEYGDYPAKGFTALFDYYSKYGFIGNSNILKMLLARKPTTLKEYIEKEYKKILK
ncbi:MAG: NmrA family NAD(P)-binding protein [Methanobacterium sp.]|uniref:SDR family oxidoreductase n=1 Tax=Methanobacterium sp. TaxID=2164 RepID=UPI003C7630DD